MISKATGALVAFAAALVAGLLAFFSLRRLQREAVAEKVDGLRAEAARHNAETLEAIAQRVVAARASVEAVGDDRAKLAELLDE